MFRCFLFMMLVACGVTHAAASSQDQDPAWIVAGEGVARDIVDEGQFIDAGKIQKLERRANAALLHGDLRDARYLASYYLVLSEEDHAKRWMQIYSDAAERRQSSRDIAISALFNAYLPALHARYADATNALQTALAGSKDPVIVGVGTQLLAYALADGGRPTSALTQVHRGLTALRGSEEHDLVSGLHDAWRYAVTDLRDYETAVLQLRASFEAAEKSRYPVDGVTIVYNLAEAASEAGRHAAAGRFAALNRRLAGATGIAVEQKFWTNYLCAKVQANAGEYAQAAQCAQTALRFAGAPREYGPRARATLTTALARLKRGPEARASLERLKREAVGRDDVLAREQLEQLEAEVLFAEGDAARAFQTLLEHHLRQEKLQARLYNVGAAELRASLEADLLAAEERADAKARETALVRRRAETQMILVFVLIAALGAGGVALVLMRRNARRLVEAQRAAEAANRTKSDFLASMSHELRTPLNGVLGMAQVLLANARDAGQREQVKTILDSGRTLTAILNDILDLSKIEAGKLEISKVDDDLPHALKRLVQLFEPQAREKGVALTLHVDDAAPRWLRFDPVRVRQCAANLVSNAVKFTDKGAIDIRVSANPEGGSTRVTIRVVDTGVGMNADTLARLFTPFTQADASVTRRFGGTGLGLAITRNLARLMDGDVTAESAAGAGTTMIFTFLADEAAEPPRATSRDDLDQRRSAGALLRGKTVLVVDDIMVNRQVAALFLQPFGARIVHASSGAEALAFLESERADIVLMDVQMPEMDGFETTRRIRLLGPEARTVPVVALTAEAMEGDRERCLAGGMDDYAPKPLEARSLLSAISRALSQDATKAA